MKNNKGAGADGETTAEGTVPETPLETGLQLHCRVLVNEMVHAGFHHAVGKEMNIPKEAAEYLAAMTPPQVEILGTV